MRKIKNKYIVDINEVKLRFKDYPNPVEHLKQDLVIIPKVFGKEESFPMILYNQKGNIFEIPYKYGKSIFGGDCETDLSLGSHIEIAFKEGITPRVEQIDILKNLWSSLRNDNRVLLEAAPSVGKTFMAIATAVKIGRTFAIVVGKSALINQWREALLKFTTLIEDDIGLVKADTFIFENKKCVLISTDSFYDREFDKTFLRYFGYVIYDEHHNFNSQKKFQALERFYAKYQLGMSATHDRRDGRDKVSQLCFGDIQVRATGVTPTPITVRLLPIYHESPLSVNYDWFKRNNIDPRWTEITKLSNLEFRNKIILKQILHEYNDNKYILCVSDRIEQLQYIYDQLVDQGIIESDLGFAARTIYTGDYKISLQINVENINDYKQRIKDYSENIKYTIGKNRIVATGFTTKNEVNTFIDHCQLILSDVSNVVSTGINKAKITLKDDLIQSILQDKSKKIILSTYGLLKEGVSIWWMSRLFDLTPQSRAEQLLGRIGRKAEDGQEKDNPIAYSTVDYGNISSRIKSIHTNRISNYKSMNYVTLENYGNNKS